MRASLLLAFALLLAACDSNTPADPEGPNGFFQATTYIIPGPTDFPEDVLARGGYVHMFFDADERVVHGTVSGSASREHEHIEGHYIFQDDSVRLSFVRGWLPKEMDWDAETQTLSGFFRARGTIELVLERVSDLEPPTP